MYIDAVDLDIKGIWMALQIANPVVLGKVERLAKHTGLNKTAVVERALDRLLAETAQGAEDAGLSARMVSLLAQMDAVPDCIAAINPLEWDELGLPK